MWHPPSKRPVFAAGRKRYYRGWRSPAYPRADIVQLFLVTHGGGDFLCRGRHIRANVGTLVVLGPDVPHAWRPNHPDGLGYDMILLREWDPARVDVLLESEACRAIRLEGEMFTAFREFYVRMEIEFEHRDAHTPAIGRALRDAVFGLLERAVEGRGSRWIRFSEPVHRARAFLRENRLGNPSAEEVARAAGGSPSHLRALFRRETGTSPKAFHLACKFESAKDMLHATDLPLKAVAQRLGFPDVHPFSVFFRDRSGLPPGRWRARDRKGPASRA